LRPHKSRYWLTSKDKLEDPERFQQDVENICETYHEAQELHEQGTHVVSTDEKTSIQALERIHPRKPPRPGLVELIEHEYKRHGTLCLIANFEERFRRPHPARHRHRSERRMDLRRRSAGHPHVGIIGSSDFRADRTCRRPWRQRTKRHPQVTQDSQTVPQRPESSHPFRIHATPLFMAQPGRNLVQHSESPNPQARQLLVC